MGSLKGDFMVASENVINRILSNIQLRIGESF